MQDPKQIVQDMAEGAALLRKGIPETMQAFGALGKAAYADGAVSEKVKEYLALAIGIATRCEGCITHHTRALHQMGASREEVLEVIGLCIQMGGGPSMVYGAKAIKAYDSFAGAV